MMERGNETRLQLQLQVQAPAQDVQCLVSKEYLADP